jgi:hypothetical protein
MFRWLSGGRRGQPRSWYTFGAAVLSGALAVGILLVAVSHRDGSFPTTRDCPSASRINTALGTRVRSPSSVSESDLLGCFYPQGSDQQAVSVSFATAPVIDPCRKHVRITVSGHEACTLTASRAANRAAISLLVESGNRQDQFSSDLQAVSLTRMEGLAERVLATTPPRLGHAPGL